jgi:trehalose 6-phosphate phosphatase
VGATATVYLGDDTTDESALSSLRPEDVGIKVGAVAPRICHLVPDTDTDTVTTILEYLRSTRSGAHDGNSPITSG